MKCQPDYWLKELYEAVVGSNYGQGTIRNYCMEMRLLFQYYQYKEVEGVTETDIRKYLLCQVQKCSLQRAINDL